jgi:hypothetical protein
MSTSIICLIKIVDYNFVVKRKLHDFLNAKSTKCKNISIHFGRNNETRTTVSFILK